MDDVQVVTFLVENPDTDQDIFAMAIWDDWSHFVIVEKYNAFFECEPIRQSFNPLPEGTTALDEAKKRALITYKQLTLYDSDKKISNDHLVMNVIKEYFAADEPNLHSEDSETNECGS